MIGAKDRRSHCGNALILLVFGEGVARADARTFPLDRWWPEHILGVHQYGTKVFGAHREVRVCDSFYDEGAIAGTRRYPVGTFQKSAAGGN